MEKNQYRHSEASLLTRWRFIDPFHKWLPVLNSFVWILISLINLVLQYKKSFELAN